LRLAKGLTQVQLARKAKVTQATVSGLETGRTKRVDFPVLERLAAVLGVAPHRLFQTVTRARRRS
jgi:transcriptional regulator with XRE-family HTH domain